MAYTYSKADIKKKSYDVFIRQHDSATWGQGPANLTGAAAFAEGTGDKYDWNQDGTWGTTGNEVYWVRIGECNEQPSMKNSEGEAVNLNTGDELVLSEITETLFEDLVIDVDNYAALRTFSKAYNADVMLVDVSETEAGNTEIAGAAANMKLNVYLEFMGNGLSKVIVTGKREAAVGDDVLTLINVAEA